MQKMIGDLPADPLASLAEFTHWAVSINTNDSFSAEQRARVLMALDAAAHPYRSELAMQYLAPDGRPAEGRDGDAAILRAMLDSATEFATGYGLSLETGEQPSRWIEKNLAHVALRRVRWLARQFTLASMLDLPNIDDIWEELHLLYGLSEERQIFRKVIRVFPGKPQTSSIKQEYVRLLLMDISGLETLLSRDIELVFRIAGRVAASARLELDPISGATCAIEPHGSSRPIAVRRLSGSDKPVLYLDAFNCLPRLKAMFERNVDFDPSDTDTMFGSGYTLRERNAMIGRLIEFWGPTPPQRRFKRVALDNVALIKIGFDNLAGVIKPLAQGDWQVPDGAASQMQIVLGDTARMKKLSSPNKALADTRIQLVDASIAGLGLLVARKEASWARLGTLIAVFVEPGPDWIVGALRRIGAEGKFLRLGIAIFSRQPRLAWFRLEATGYASVWEEEQRHERNFLEHFQRGILVNADRAPLGSGEILLPPGVADRGSRLDIPLAQGVQRIRISAVREATESFHRAAFEPLGVTPYAVKEK